MKELPKLNFPPFRFKTKIITEKGPRIWDDLRKCWLVLTPEEWVRQHLIKFLVEIHNVNPRLISQEFPVCINGTKQRADLVIYDRQREKILLAECKAPDININDSVYVQAVRYNSIVGARYILLTNGFKHYLYEKMEDGKYSALGDFPALS